LSRTAPVTIAISGDPVAAGFAESFAGPGGNVTGVGLLALGRAADAAEKVGPALKIVSGPRGLDLPQTLLVRADEVIE
jgi:ABC-type uncharacterized transport system substrate-binding protein